MSARSEDEEDEIDGRDAGAAGFSAKLDAASLTDLLQLQCLSRVRCVARVSSADEVGYLYFRDGHVVHAMSSAHVGEQAVFEILSWTCGRFELCSAGWPENETIQIGHQELLLKAARLHDESGRYSLVHLSRQGATPPQARSDHASSSEPKEPMDAEVGNHRPSSEAPVSGTVTRVTSVVRVDETGTPILSKGTGAEQLLEAMALSSRLARLIGEGLGLATLVSIEGVATNLRTLIFPERSGRMVGVRAPLDVDLTSFRERHGAGLR